MRSTDAASGGATVDGVVGGVGSGTPHAGHCPWHGPTIRPLLNRERTVQTDHSPNCWGTGAGAELYDGGGKRGSVSRSIVRDRADKVRFLCNKRTLPRDAIMFAGLLHDKVGVGGCESSHSSTPNTRRRRADRPSAYARQGRGASACVGHEWIQGRRPTVLAHPRRRRRPRMGELRGVRKSDVGSVARFQQRAEGLEASRGEPPSAAKLAGNELVRSGLTPGTTAAMSSTSSTGPQLAAMDGAARSRRIAVGCRKSSVRRPDSRPS